MSSARYMAGRLRRLREWRLIARIVARAVKHALGEEAEVYVIGGAAEDRLTALSDIDVLVVLHRDVSREETGRISRLIYEKAVELGMPWDYPIDIHVAGPSLLKLYKKYAKLMIRIE